MRKSIFFWVFMFSSVMMAQTYTITGRITDAEDKNEALIGASVLYGDGRGTVADVDGNYRISLPAGDYTITFSYVGYEKVTKDISLNSDLTLDVQLSSSVMMKEVTVVADIAIARETPVAFSTLSPKTLEETLASQDIPMALNSTPGVYATQEGGGEGDAEVTIRGFSSRNVGVLLDGVPVNDMENGHVYWSNWFGLDAVTRSMQVQRGLGASKLALPSVGGTINIMTKGLENKKGGSLKQEFGSDGMLRTSLGYNTGALKNGWGFSFAGSYKQGDGYVDQTSYRGVFWYAKVDKKLGDHTISLSAYGAPQEHAQRAYKLPLAVYDSTLAEELGVSLHYEDDMTIDERAKTDTNRLKADEGIGRGIRFNQHWGYLTRHADPNAQEEVLNERVNQYHKPQFTLKDSWTVSDRLFVSNILYASIGNGGGVRAAESVSWLTPNEDGLINFQDVYDANRSVIAKDEDGLYGTSNGYLRRLVNSHRWYGLLSTANYEYDAYTFSGGVDVRYYKGIHYQEVYDMLGADYVKRNPDEMLDGDTKDKLYVGDKTNYHNDGIVKWGGLFFQTEYKRDNLSAFINLTGALSAYQRIDYFSGISEGLAKEVSDVMRFPGMTVKGGANYNLNDQMNVFANIGYLNKAPRFSNVFDYDNVVFTEIENEKVKAFEIGYSLHTPMVSANLNTYYTLWENRPVDYASSTTIDGEEYSVNINGMDALHKGIELDVAFTPIEQLKIQGLMSLGDWRWNSAEEYRIYDSGQDLIFSSSFDAKGVHVGNSAQTQFAGEVRWEPIKFLYFTARWTYFDRYFAEFDPISLDPSSSPESFDEEGNPRDSWQVPSYGLMDLHAGYSHKIMDYILSVRFNVINALDKTYIATAQNNDTYNGTSLQGFDARSASVFMGLGRRYNVSMSIKF